MREVIQSLVAQIVTKLAKLAGEAAECEEVRGLGASKTAAELAALNHRLDKLKSDERLALGRPPNPDAAPARKAKKVRA